MTTPLPPTRIALRDLPIIMTHDFLVGRFSIEAEEELPPLAEITYHISAGGFLNICVKIDNRIYPDHVPFFPDTTRDTFQVCSRAICCNLAQRIRNHEGEEIFMESALKDPRL